MTDYDLLALCTLSAYLDERPYRQMSLAQVTEYFGWRDEASAYRAMRYALRLTQGKYPYLVTGSCEGGSFLHTYIEGGMTMNEQDKQETAATTEPIVQDTAAAQEQPTTDAPAAQQTAEAGSQSHTAPGEAAEMAEAPVQEEPPKDEPTQTADPAAQVAALTQKAAEAELRAAAALAGVPAGKLPYVLRMCDSSALCAEGADMGQLAQEQIADVIRDVPEMAGGRPVAGSLGDHKRVGSGTDPEDEARATFAKYL